MSKKTALFLSILFLVHPANEETVAYASSLQDVLFFFFGMIAVILAFRGKNLSFKNLFLINIALLLSLLSKETGVLFVLIVILIFFLEKIKNLGNSILFVFTTLGGYIILRLISYNYFFLYLHSSDLQTVSFLQKLSNVPNIFLFYLREIIFPIGKIVPHLFKINEPTSTAVFFIFSISIILMISILFLVAKKVKQSSRKHFGYLFFFTFWFVLGIIFHLQLISLDIVVATRWLYFPLVGFLGVLGFTFESIENRRLKKLISILGIIVVIFFLYQTIQLNSYWKSEEILNQHIENIGF